MAVRTLGAGGVGQQRLLQRQEQADIARGRVERADETDHHQRPEARLQREADAGGDHQQGRAEQQQARAVAMGAEAHQQGQRRRSRQRRGGEDADMEGVEAQELQIYGQQQADEAVAEGAQAPAQQQQPSLRPGVARQQARAVHVSRAMPSAPSAPRITTSQGGTRQKASSRKATRPRMKSGAAKMALVQTGR